MEKGKRIIYGVISFKVKSYGVFPVVGEFGVDEFGVDEFGVDEFGVDEFGVDEFGVDEFGVDGFGVGEFGVDEFGVDEFGVETENLPYQTLQNSKTPGLQDSRPLSPSAAWTGRNPKCRYFAPGLPLLVICLLVYGAFALLLKQQPRKVS